MRKIICLLILIAITAGCGTFHSIEQQRGKGLKKVYNYSYKDVYMAAVRSINSLQLFMLKNSEKEGYIYATEGSRWSWGEKIAIYINKIGEDTTEVEILTGKILVPLAMPSATIWEKDILLEIDRKLGDAFLLGKKQ